jgi:hypothetical protein
MNELHRQMYLSALGVDTYMPRWYLPFAAQSIACELPVATEATAPNTPQVGVQVEYIVKPNLIQSALQTLSVTPSPVNHIIGDILDTKKAAKQNIQLIGAAEILAQLNTKPVTLDPFSLSIWRPVDGVMVIDSRNTKLALPTELLLNNVLRSVFSHQALKSQEEVLRWPMIENSFAKRSSLDARNELQTWLSVQNEIRPIRYLWLMGLNSAAYLLPETDMYAELLFKATSVVGISINALILPSLNELLKNPASKQKLFAAISAYHLASE